MAARIDTIGRIDDTAFRIVEMLCDGMTEAAVMQALDISVGNYMPRIKAMQELARLPKDKRTYKACPGLIRENLAKVRKMLEDREKAVSELQESLIQFDF